MHFLKRFVSTLITAAAVFTALVLPASAEKARLADAYNLTPHELIARIEQTYDEARYLAGRRNFSGKCSTLVNCSTLALGIQNVRFDGDGRDEYDLYDNVTRTDGGYDVVRYPAPQYSLEDALNAISENGTRDVYNIIVGFEGGRTASSSKYGHTCFIHGIVDGMVYYSESYSLYLNGTYYPEGEPIVCSIWEFAEYYGKWAYFEGVIHLDFPDETAPVLSGLSVSNVSESGFTLSFRAEDNIGVIDLCAKVWTYGESEEDAVTLPVTRLGNGAAVRVNSADFGGFVGTYYVNCYAVDRKGNVSVISTEESGISLYQAEASEGLYRVKQDNTGVHNAPAVRVNETNTRERVLNGGVKVEIVGSYVNEDGETWYLLADGGWVHAEQLRKAGADLTELLINVWEALTVTKAVRTIPMR